MGAITQPVTTIAPDVSSFGAGGQMYMATMFGGFNVSSETNNPLFSFRCTDSNVPNARQLTNLTEAQKIGSTMSFRAARVGFRVLNFGTGVITPAQAEEMKRLLASAVITLTVGNNDTKIAEFSGMDLMQPVDYVAQDTNPASGAGLGGGIGWITLQIPLELQANVSIGGMVKFTRAVPSALTSTPNSFGFVVLLQGLKIVKS